MPNATAPTNGKSRYTGWYNDRVNGLLELYYEGTKVGDHTNAFDPSAALTPASVAAVGAVSAGSTVAATTTVTGGTGVIATTGDIKGTAGNLRLGVVSAFGTTEPTSAVVLKQGTAPVGAIATSSGIFASATVMRKIIADGTASNVET
jgi:hypothetical protein